MKDGASDSERGEPDADEMYAAPLCNDTLASPKGPLLALHHAFFIWISHSVSLIFFLHQGASYLQNKTKQKSFRPPFNTVEILKK